MRTQQDYERIYHALYRQCGCDIDDFITAIAKSAVLRRGAIEEILDKQAAPILAENSKASSPVEYTIIFDGGARTNPGDGYGSWIVEEEGVAWPVRRREFGPNRTNNECEYMTLIEALKELVYDVGVSSQDTLVIRGDSKLVLYQVGVDPKTGKSWKVKEPRLAPLCSKARDLLKDFKSFKVVWQPREDSVAVLGH